MKITIPMNEQTLESGVCPSFGRAPYFLLYDTDTSESQWIVNSAAENAFLHRKVLERTLLFP